MNPYRVVGVNKDADKEQIEKAYRIKARKLHPDRGGDEAKFKILQRCYDLLMNDDKRKFFDDNGVMPEDKTDNSAGELIGLLSQVFTKVFSIALQEKVELKNKEVVKEMRQMIDQSRQQLKQKLADLTMLKTNLLECISRFDVDDGENLMVAIIKTQLGLLEKDIATIAKPIEIHDKGYDLLARYKFRHVPGADKKVPMSFMDALAASMNGDPRMFKATWGQI